MPVLRLEFSLRPMTSETARQRVARIDRREEAAIGIAEIGDRIERDVRHGLAEHDVEDQQIVDRRARIADRLGEGVGGLDGEARAVERGVERDVAGRDRARRGVRMAWPRRKSSKKLPGLVLVMAGSRCSPRHGSDSMFAHIPEKLGPDPIGAGSRFSDKDMRQRKGRHPRDGARVSPCWCTSPAISTTTKPSCCRMKLAVEATRWAGCSTRNGYQETVLQVPQLALVIHLEAQQRIPRRCRSPQRGLDSFCAGAQAAESAGWWSGLHDAAVPPLRTRKPSCRNERRNSSRRPSPDDSAPSSTPCACSTWNWESARSIEAMRRVASPIAQSTPAICFRIGR